jgi:hypothetical protein
VAREYGMVSDSIQVVKTVDTILHATPMFALQD